LLKQLRFLNAKILPKHSRSKPGTHSQGIVLIWIDFGEAEINYASVIQLEGSCFTGLETSTPIQTNCQALHS
jgi:hypothetical protein